MSKVHKDHHEGCLDCPGRGTCEEDCKGGTGVAVLDEPQVYRGAINFTDIRQHTKGRRVPIEHFAAIVVRDVSGGIVIAAYRGAIVSGHLVIGGESQEPFFSSSVDILSFS